MRFNLSEIVELIRTRRTIRPEHYSERVVHKEIIENLINSAIWAPTHGMTQPWRFKVFTGKGLERLSVNLPELYRNFAGEADFKQKKFEKLGGMPLKSSVVIAVCMSPDPTGKIPEIEEVGAVACAVQNMMLHATAYGLGSFWSSPKFCYTSEMNHFLGLDEQEKCLGLFYLGYPQGDWPKSHRKPIEYVTEWVED